MARAKRIDRDRADARRRYRAAVAANEAEPLEGEDEAGTEAASAAAPGAGTSSPAAARGPRAASARGAAQPLRARMGLREAFFAAYRPLHLRDDLRRFPAIVTHWSVWGPIAVAVLATILEIAVGANNSLSSFLFSLFVAPGAVAGVFIAGYFAPTAAYLAGLVVALASSILFAIAAWAAYSSGTSGLTEEVVVGSITTGFIIGPLYGIFLGATAAWYKRFLAATSPARPPRPTAQQSGNRRRQGPRAKTR